MNGITLLGEWCDGQDPSVSIALWSLSFIAIASSWLMHIPLTMRLCNSWIPEEHFVCYQTSQRNWVIIKMLYRCLLRCLLGWHRSRLEFVTLSIGEVSLGPLGKAHHNKPCKQYVTNELVAGWCITKWVKTLAGNDIELGMKIPTIESRASNIPMTKGITYVVITVRPIKIFVEYVGTNMSIQVPLLVIDRRGVSVMST